MGQGQGGTGLLSCNRRSGSIRAHVPFPKAPSESGRGSWVTWPLLLTSLTFHLTGHGTGHLKSLLPNQASCV